MDNKIIDQLEAIYSGEFTLVSGDPGNLEEMVKAKMQQSSRKIEAITGQKVSDNTIERVVCQVGSVEGVCKNVVGKRLKQSGMIWTRSGSSLVLSLRVCWLNDEWEQLCQKKPLSA